MNGREDLFWFLPQREDRLDVRRGGTVPGMRACSAGDFAPYDTKTAAYHDNVVSWPSVEPADDYAAGSLRAFALGAARDPGLG